MISTAWLLSSKNSATTAHRLCQVLHEWVNLNTSYNLWAEVALFLEESSLDNSFNNCITYIV